MPFASVSKRVLVHNLSYIDEFDLQDNKRAGKSHFHMNGCALTRTRFEGRFETCRGKRQLGNGLLIYMTSRISEYSRSFFDWTIRIGNSSGAGCSKGG